MTLPKTQKGLSNSITKIRSQLSAFKREYGFIDDGNGSRYYLFYLYFLLGDNRRSSEYIRWYKQSFPTDMGEPIAFLCWALILHRMGKEGDFILARTMISNLYLIPHLLGEEIERIDMWHSCSDEDPDYIDWLPGQIREAITEEDLGWIRERYNSVPFIRVRDRYIAINKELETLPRGEKRSALADEELHLLDDWR